MSESGQEGHPVHLPDGSWGVKIEGGIGVKPGDQVTVTSRSGRTWTTTIGAIVTRDRWGVTCTSKEGAPPPIKWPDHPKRSRRSAPKSSTRPPPIDPNPFIDDDPDSTV